jgi:hypothetical protein
MRNLFISVSILFILIVFVDRGLAWYMDSKYEQNFNHYTNGHINHYLKFGNCDTLLLGSSRVLDNLDPTIFGPRTYNLSQAQKHIGWFAALADLMKGKGRFPMKLLLVNIEPEDFSRNGGYDLLADIHYLKYYYDQNDFIRKEIKSASQTEWLKYLSALYRHNGEGMLLLTNPLQNIGFHAENRGYIPIQKDEYDSARVMETISFTEKPYDPDFTHVAAFRYLAHLVKICKSRNVQLVIITAPYYRPSTYSKKSAQLLQTFLAKKGIRYLNYLEKKLGDLQQLKYWHDNKHFNAEGAHFFSRLVKQDLLISR